MFFQTFLKRPVARKDQLKLSFVFGELGRLDEDVLSLFLGISSRTEHDKLILVFRRPRNVFPRFQKKGIDAVGDDEAVGRARRIFKDVFYKLRGVMHAVAVTINCAVKVAIHLFVKPLIIHQFNMV